jgi:hypothetical protein
MAAAQELLGAAQPELQIVVAGGPSPASEVEVHRRGLGAAARVHQGARQPREHLAGVAERPRRRPGLLVSRERLPVQARGAIERQRRRGLLRGEHQVARGLLEIARRVEVHAHRLGPPPRVIARARRLRRRRRDRGLARRRRRPLRWSHREERPGERAMTFLALLGAYMLEHGLADPIVVRLDGVLAAVAGGAHQVCVAQPGERRIERVGGQLGRGDEHLRRQRPPRHRGQRQHLPRRRIELGDPRP